MVKESLKKTETNSLPNIFLPRSCIRSELATQKLLYIHRTILSRVKSKMANTLTEITYGVIIIHQFVYICAHYRIRSSFTINKRHAKKMAAKCSLIEHFCAYL